MSSTTHTTQTRRGREIAHSEWEAFCLQFTQDHQEWLVEVAPRDEGSRRASHERRGLPFEALMLHLDHTDEVLSIMVRKSDVLQEHIYRSISSPRRMMIETETEIADVSLHIDSTDGTSTTIRFSRVETPDYNAATIHGIPSDER
jgi:hypothetical protein